QQYMQKYKQGEKKPEGAPADQPAAAPVAQPAAAPVAQPAPAAQPVPAVQPVVAQEPSPVAQPTEKITPVQIEEPKPKKVVKPYVPTEYPTFFKVTGFVDTYFNMGTIFGSDVTKRSFQFGLGQASLDFEGGISYFSGRLFLDLAKGLKTVRTWGHDYTPGALKPDLDMTPDEPNALDILQAAYINFVHPKAFVDIKMGQFLMPFGIENTFYQPMVWDSLLRSSYLGGGFNDLGAELGVNIPFKNKTMHLRARYFIFNGKNEQMLDGDDYFKDPAHGFDVRFDMRKDFYMTIAASMIIGSAYHDLDVDNPDGIYQTSSAAGGPVIKNADGENEWAFNKKNFLMAFAADLGYTVNRNLNIGLQGEFVYSLRALHNEYIAGQATTYYQDAYLQEFTDRNYSSYGIFVAPYAKLWMIDTMIRFSYFKQPYLYTWLNDSQNSTLALDVMVRANFFSFASVGLNYRFIKEEATRYDDNIDNTYYITDTYFTHVILLDLALQYGKLWEGKVKM
ncbi:hypothetical protein KAH37_00680, partial [bacterium]|nr:hypothetical protein [bacterium]